MSQPIHADQNASPEPDPLLAFAAEQSEAVEAVKPAEDRHQVPEDLRLRVERAERLVDRALIEITTLRTDLATLVSAVEDIKKRQSRRDVPPAPAAPTAKRMSPWRAALAAAALAAAAAWGLMSTTSYDLFLR